MEWLFYIVVLGAVATWLKKFVSQFLPDLPPKRVQLAIANYLDKRWGKPLRPEDSFRVILCWLENDRSGGDTRNVEAAFMGVEGIKLIRSAVHCVRIPVPGTNDVETCADVLSSVLEYLNADLAVCRHGEENRGGIESMVRAPSGRRHA